MNESVLLFISCFKPASVGQSHRQVFVCKRSLARLFCLCNVAVFVCRGLASLDVLLVDEHLDALLDHADTWVEPGFGLIDDLHTGKVERNVTNRYATDSETTSAIVCIYFRYFSCET